MEKRYSPFDVGPPERFSDEDKAIVHFLEAAYEAGFRPYDSFLSYYGATADNERVGEIIARGRSRWELALAAEHEEILSVYLDDFGCAADAVLGWLRGAEAKQILAQLQDHLVVLPGASRSFTLNVPNPLAIQSGLPLTHDGK